MRNAHDGALPQQHKDDAMLHAALYDLDGVEFLISIFLLRNAGILVVNK